MSAEVERLAMGRVVVVTRDRYENERVYEFKPAGNSFMVEPTGDGRKYTPVVLKALWDEGIVVDWDPDELTADERAQLNGFCDDCGTAIHSQQVARDKFRYWCPDCEEETVKQTV